MRSRDTGSATPPYRVLFGAVLVAAVLLGHAWAASVSPRPAGLTGHWLGTWKSTQSPAGGRFSAALSSRPAWWGGAEIVGTLQFGGAVCVGVLTVSGTYFRGREYLLTAKGTDGAVRMTSTVTVTNSPPRSLSGHYDVVPHGPGCGPDSGRLDATAR